MRCRRSVLSLALSALAVAPAAPAAEAYEAVEVRDGGAIEGKLVYHGTVPTRKIIPTKDKEICGAIRDVPQVLVGPDKGVENGIVYLKKVEKGKAWEKAAKTPVIDNVKCEFQPPIQVVPAGDVEIVNSDPVLHNTRGFVGRLGVFNVALPIQGQRVTRTLKRTGLVRLDCDAHGWMEGWMLVAENPYHAVTAKDGSFTIKDVPSGSYTLVGWQAYTGEVEVPVTVKPKEVVSVTVELKRK